MQNWHILAMLLPKPTVMMIMYDILLYLLHYYNILLHNKIESTFAPVSKFWFKKNCTLNVIRTFIFACKPRKTIKKGVEISRNAHSTSFWTPITQKSGSKLLMLI